MMITKGAAVLKYDGEYSEELFQRTLARLDVCASCGAGSDIDLLLTRATKACQSDDLCLGSLTQLPLSSGARHMLFNSRLAAPTSCSDENKAEMSEM